MTARELAPRSLRANYRSSTGTRGSVTPLSLTQILDRLLSRSHRLALKGESLRPRKATAAATTAIVDIEPVKLSGGTGKSY